MVQQSLAEWLLKHVKHLHVSIYIVCGCCISLRRIVGYSSDTKDMPAPYKPKARNSSKNCCMQLVVYLRKTRLQDKILLLFVLGIVLVAGLFYQHGLYIRRLIHEFHPSTQIRDGVVDVENDENSVNYNGITDRLILKVLERLEAPVTDTDFAHIFKGNLADNQTWEFDFGELSKRRFGRSYVEQTSFDNIARNGDFFNPVAAGNGGLVLFEDYGPGIFERLLIFHRTNLKANMDTVTFEVDGTDMFTSNVVSQETYPFTVPFIRTNGLDNMAGYYVTFPVSYTKSLRIILKWGGSSKLDDGKLWDATRKCKVKNSQCPVIAYYSVISNKLFHGVKLRSTFKDYLPQNSSEPKTKVLKSVTKAVSEMATSPEKYGPGLKSRCKLFCQEIPSGGEIVIYSAANVAKVIQSMIFRIYDKKEGGFVISKNWRRILITMTWDGKEPQVREIPLAGFIISGLDYLREVRGLTAGLGKMTCDIDGRHASKLKLNDWLAYLYYEMPFWKSANITVRIPHGYESAIICSKITAKDLDVDTYHPQLTGYFSVQLNQQGFDYDHHKTVLHLEKQWGHVVAINFFMRNSKIASTHELDLIIETDRADVPVWSGTGLEDFFHYVHDFQANRNRSSVFNGAPYYVRRGRYRILRCYRHMIFDPILFTTGIRIYVEANFGRDKKPVFRQFLRSSSNFSQNILPDSLFTVVLFYGGKGEGGITTDKVEYKEANQNSLSKLQLSPPSVDMFPVHSMFENQPGISFDKIVVSLKPGQQATFTLKISKNNVGVILRGEYHSVVPNQKAHVMVDGKDAGTWFCPQRALSKSFSFRLNDYLLPPRQTAGKDSIGITLVALTRWEAISVKALSVVLSN